LPNFILKFKNSKKFEKNPKKYDKKLGVFLSTLVKKSFKSKVI